MCISTILFTISGLTKFNEIIVAFVTGVIGPTVIFLVKHYFDNKAKTSDMVLDTIAVSNLISNKLDEIKDEIGADRVWITQFHNGGHFYPTGKSIAKFSVMYETVTAGVNSIQHNLQNIPVNLFSKTINELHIHEKICIPNLSDKSHSNFGLDILLEHSKCKSIYLFSIKSISGKYIGNLGVDFVKKKTELDPESISKLSNYAATIGGVLMSHLNKQ